MEGWKIGGKGGRMEDRREGWKGGGVEEPAFLLSFLLSTCQPFNLSEDQKREFNRTYANLARDGRFFSFKPPKESTV